MFIAEPRFGASNDAEEPEGEGTGDEEIDMTTGTGCGMHEVETGADVG